MMNKNQIRILDEISDGLIYICYFSMAVTIMTLCGAGLYASGMILGDLDKVKQFDFLLLCFAFVSMISFMMGAELPKPWKKVA